MRNIFMIYEKEMIRALAHRTGLAFNSGETNFAYTGALTGLAIIENGLDQNVSVQLQGRARGGSTWQAVGAASVVAAGAAGSIAITAPWPEVRIACTPAGVCTAGTFSAWFSAV